jgi:hypothetical protein
VSLTEVLKDREKSRVIIEDAARILDEEVASKGGLKGMAVKGGYKTVKRLKPGMIMSALGMLLPEFAPTLDPFYEQAKASGDVRGYFMAQRGPVADALLAVTDARAARAKNQVMKKVYGSLRASAREHTMAGVPRLAELFERHVG